MIKERIEDILVEEALFIFYIKSHKAFFRIGSRVKESTKIVKFKSNYLTQDIQGVLNNLTQ